MCSPYLVIIDKYIVKPNLHLNANVNNACGREPRQNVWYIRTLFGLHHGSELTLHKHIIC